MPSLQLVQLVTIRSSSYRKGSCGIEDWSRKRLVSELGSATFEFDPPMNLGSRSTYVILSSPLSSVRIACFLPSQRASPLITIAIFGKEAVYLQEPCSFSPRAPGLLRNSILNIAVISLSNQKVWSSGKVRFWLALLCLCPCSRCYYLLCCFLSY